MLTKRKQKILKGVYNNLFSKILGYPTALIFSDLDTGVKYSVDILKKKIFPSVSTDEKYLNELNQWFRDELKTRSINKKNIKRCVLDVYIEKSKFLFIPYKMFEFKLILVSELEKLESTRTSRGWL